MRLLRHLLAGLLLIGSAADAADKTLRMAITTLPTSFANPFVTANTPAIGVTSALYDGLTHIARDGTVKPWLAIAWQNVDAKTWRFELRRDVKFSNGAAFNAGTVAAVVDALAAPGFPNENLRRELPKLAKARVVDPFTVEITTAEPQPLFPRWASILLMHEPGALRKMGTDKYAKDPVVTGPYSVQKWEPNKVHLKAENKSWRKPKVEKIEITALPDTAARVAALLSKRMDIVTALGPEDVQAVVAGGAKSISWTDGSVAGISFVTSRKLPFNDVRVRQAMNMAVNRDAIVEILLHGATVTANQPAGRYVLGYDPGAPPYPYDPAKARALLASAGHPDGFRFTLETAGNGAAALSVYQQVAADLKKVGVTMEIRTVPVPQFFRDVLHTGDTADAITLSWISAPSLDVLPAIRVHSCLQQQPWYCDPDVTPLYTAAVSEFDDAKGLALRRQISLRYHDQAPALFLYEQVLFAGLSKRVSGFEDVYGFISYDKLDIRD